MLTLFWRNYRIKILLIILCLFVGWVRFELRLISVKQLVSFLPESQFPLLLIALAFFNLLFLSFLQWLKAEAKVIWTFLSLLVLSLTVLPLFKAQIANAGNIIILNGAIFVVSTVGVSLLDSFTGHTVSRHASFFSRFNFTGRITFFIELGFFFAALCVHATGPWINLLISCGAVGLLFALVSKPPKVQKLEEETERDQTFPPYLPIAMLLFMIFALLKYYQAYLLFSGLKSLVQEGYDLTDTFSHVNLIQSGVILLFLVFSFRDREDKWSWRQGFLTFSWTQLISFGILFLFISPWAMLVNESVRKVFENSILANYKKKLEQNFPFFQRWKLQHQIETWSNFLGPLFCGLIIYPVVKGALDVRWTIVLFILLLGGSIYLIFELFSRVNKHQIAEINSLNPNRNQFVAVEIIQNFAHNDYKTHWPTLVQLIEREERPIIIKSAARSLAQMNPKESVAILLTAFRKHEREDIKVAIIKSLSQVKSYEIDNFVLAEYEKIIKESKQIENIYFDLLKVMSERVRESFILNSLRIYHELESEQGNSRIIANLVEVLGHIATKKNDHELFEFFMHLYAKTDNRRIKINLLRYLYLSPKQRHFVLTEIEKMMTSYDQFDRNGVIFLLGKLKLKAYIKYILLNLEIQNFENSTCLISLLELVHPKANYYYGRFILSKSQDEVITSLNQFHEIESSKVRFGFYDHFIENQSSHVPELLLLLKKTSRDFDSDRKIIFQQIHFNG